VRYGAAGGKHGKTGVHSITKLVIKKVENGRSQFQLRIWSSVRCPGATLWCNLKQQKDPNALVLERKKTTYCIRTPRPLFWKGKNNI
jgi:hypothetical protein